MYRIYLECMGNHLSISSLAASHEQLWWFSGLLGMLLTVYNCQCHLSINQRGNLELEKHGQLGTLDVRRL